MSSEPQLEGGGGTTDSTSDTSDSDGANATFRDQTLTIALPDWVLALRPLAGIVNDLIFIVTRPRVFIVVALTGLSAETVSRLLLEKSAVAIIIDDYIFRTVLLPLGIELFVGGLNAIDEFILLSLGTDRRVGVAPGHQPGLADFPLVVAAPIAQSFLTFGLSVFNAVDVFNRSLARDLEGIGLAAPAFVNLIWAAELTAIGALIWVMLSFIPFFNVRGIMLSLTSLPRKALRRLL